MEQGIVGYIASGDFLSQRVADQHYLRKCIWPTVAQSVINHDSQGYDPEAFDFPSHEKKTDFEDLSQFHVGMNEGSSEVWVSVEIPEVEWVKWVLKNDQNQEVCSYKNKVLNNRKIFVELPRRYARQLQAKTWTIHVYATENID